MTTIAIIDYGMGNLHSIAKALEHVAGKRRVIVSSDRSAILSAGHVVFPGVGAIRDCMGELRKTGLDEVVRQVAVEKPVLGVCLGLQALFDESEENGGTSCLGIVPGRVLRFPLNLQNPSSGERLKIPHMGWNQVHQVCAHALWQDIPDQSRFYFVHSYYAIPAVTAHIAGTTGYGHEFTSVIARDNLFAAQFHPEKSQHAGLQLLENFVSWNGEQ
jgi:glutamine amidotransferase